MIRADDLMQIVYTSAKVTVCHAVNDNRIAATKENQFTVLKYLTQRTSLIIITILKVKAGDTACLFLTQ